LITKKIRVINFGADTTIMDTFKSIKRLPDKSETFYEGMNDIHRKIRNKLERDHNIKGLNTSFIDDGFRRGDFIANISERKKYSIEDIAKEGIIDFTDNTLSDIDTTLQNRE